jgi:hypothetical protein
MGSICLSNAPIHAEVPGRFTPEIAHPRAVVTHEETRQRIE